MKIITPIDNLGELESLIEAGADEFYGGYIPEGWQQHFSLLTSINQRTFDTAQITSREELSGIINRVHSAGKTFSLTLNSPFYTDNQLPIILDFVDAMVDVGVDGVILADLSLLRGLQGRHEGLELHASTLAHLGNSLAIGLYVEAGIDRMVFPRHMPVAEMAAIADRFPDVTFDAFLLVGKCPNTEGLCTFHHSSSDKIWPCEIPYQIDPAGSLASPVLAEAIQRQNSWSETNRRHGCGLCAIPHLMEAGVEGLKLVGRGAPPAQKVRNILLVRDFLSLAATEPDFAEYRRKAIAAHRERFGSPCSPNICYFPEFYMAE